MLLQGRVTKPSEKESLLTAPIPNTGNPWIYVPRWAKEMIKCPTRNMANSSLDNADNNPYFQYTTHKVIEKCSISVFIRITFVYLAISLSVIPLNQLVWPMSHRDRQLPHTRYWLINALGAARPYPGRLGNPLTLSSHFFWSADHNLWTRKEHLYSHKIF